MQGRGETARIGQACGVSDGLAVFLRQSVYKSGIGAVVGGWIGKNIGFLPPGDPGDWLPSLRSVLTATVGAIVVLAVWKWVRK